MSSYVPSYMRNGSYGGFTTNGENNSSQQLRRLDFDTSSRETSADERSRSRDPNSNNWQGGYGSFGPSPGVRAPVHLDRTHANRRSRGYNEFSPSRSPSRSGLASGRTGAGGQVEGVMRYIHQQWGFMSSTSCIPVKIALQLMDPSSLGLAEQYDQFQDTHDQLQSALKLVVNEHHQGFNSSIGTFHNIQRAIHASHQRVRSLRAGLVQAKSALGIAGVGKPELKSLAQISKDYDEILVAVTIIEQLQLVPEKLETQISEKRFLGAVDSLQEALRLIGRPDMEEIGALADLRVYLSNQEHSLTDILVEELHSHLYLKSPYCEERWKSHTRRDASTAGLMDSGERAMHAFLDEYDGTKPMQEDSTRNPEADTFYYIQLLMESLNRMNKLDVAVNAIEQRLPVELFRVVERSHTEVEQRHPNSAMRSNSAGSRRADHFGLGETPEAEKTATLEDLLVTLYAKLEAIAEGHRVLHDVTAAILKRDGVVGDDAQNLNRSFRELWKLFQSEIRSLLHDHLASDGDVGSRSRKDDNAISSNIFKVQPRDRQKKLFKLSYTSDRNGKANSDLATEREDLEFILKSSVPGLIDREAQSTIKARDKDEGIPDRSATGHKLLVAPSVFNMSILLPPSLDFLTRLKDVVPPGSRVVPSTLTSFLDDFLINVFYPQLDETLVDLCGRTMNDLDAFAVHPSWQTHASKPIFRGSVRFYELIAAFCAMLDTLPHEQSFSQLVITQMRAFYDRCFRWLKGLLQRAQMASQVSEGVRMKLAADLASTGQVNETVLKILKANESGGQERQLAEEEAQLLLDVVKDRLIEEGDLLNDRKALAGLCTLHSSMLWLAARCRRLRFISSRAVDSQNEHPHSSRRWTHAGNSASGAIDPSEVFLPLDPSTAMQFDAVTASFTELAEIVLRTLHIDLRLHLVFGVTNALSTTYRLEQPYNDPDPAMLALTASISAYDAQLSTYLLGKYFGFVTSSLDALVDACFTNPAILRLIQGMDGYGRDRMQLNVLVLQQCLKGLQGDADLARAARFYALAAEGGSLEQVAVQGRREGFEEESVAALLDMLSR